MKLFIAEKPSLAQAIAAGIGVGKKSDGYISLNGGKEIVTWCYGHILVQLNPNESILTGVSAYEFLRLLKAKAAEIHFKTWLEFSYKNYSHGKFLLSDKIPKDESISAFLRTRLDRNRQHLLHNPQDLKQYIPTGKTIHADDLLQQVKLESTLFQAVMDDFEQEENSYLSNRPELCHLS